MFVSIKIDFYFYQKMKKILGNVLDSTTQIIAHQCNCVTDRGKGLSHSLFSRFPQADIYSTRTGKDRPGFVVFKQCSNVIIANMLAQFYPGPSKYANDTVEKRQQWFVDCLDQIGKYMIENNIKTISFPHNIGCGLAGGNRRIYKQMLKKFEEKHEIEIWLYKLK